MYSIKRFCPLLTPLFLSLSVGCASAFASAAVAQEREFFFDGRVTSIIQNESAFLSGLESGDLFTGRIVVPVADLRLNETVASRSTLIEVFFDAGPVRWQGDSTFIRAFDGTSGNSLSFAADAGGTPVVLVDEPVGLRPINFGIDLDDPTGTVFDSKLPEALDLSQFSSGSFTLLANFGGGSTSTPSDPVWLFGTLNRFSTAIPEPSSLMVVSGMGLLLVRRVRG